MNADNEFLEATELCEETQAELHSQESCTIGMAVLGRRPYNLQQGDSIYAKASSSNLIGAGRLSDESNGAVYTECSNGEPDAPVNLAEMKEFRTETSLKITWEDGKCDGNSPIESYTVVYTARGSSSAEFVEIDADLHYYEITNLESKEGYDVEIFATNANGDSGVSQSVEIAPILREITGSEPPAPTNLAYDKDTMTASSMVVMWSQNGNGGAPITQYLLSVTKDNGIAEEIKVDASQM